MMGFPPSCTDAAGDSELWQCESVGGSTTSGGAPPSPGNTSLSFWKTDGLSSSSETSWPGDGTDSDDSTVKILRIHLAPKKRDRVLVHIEGREPLEITLDVMDRSGIHVGTELEPADLARLQEDDAKWRVRQAALHLLSYQPRAEQELRTRLRAKDHPPALVEWCIHLLREQGFLDDAAFAAAFARSRIRLRPRGRFRLMQELRQKGVPGEVADKAIENAFCDEETSEQRLASEAAQKWIERQSRTVAEALAANDRSPERERGRRRLHAFLSRRGFASDAINSALTAAFERAADLCVPEAS